MSTVVILALVALALIAIVAVVKPELRDSLLITRDKLVAQPWFPNRRVIVGAVTAIITGALAYFAIDVNDPLVLSGITVAVAKIVEYLLPPSEVDIEKGVRYQRRKDREDHPLGVHSAGPVGRPRL